MIPSGLTGWTRRGIKEPDLMRCEACGYLGPATLSAAMHHHERTLEYAGTRISRCDDRRISEDGS